MSKEFCSHCRTLFDTEDAFVAHFGDVVVPYNAGRRERGGMFVTVDGQEYWGPTTREMQAEGFKVVIRHNRWRRGVIRGFGRLGMYGSEITPKGGSTYVLILAPDGYWAEGIVKCSRKDVYSKKVGWVLAVNQALSQLPGQLYNFDKSFKEALKEITS